MCVHIECAHLCTCAYTDQHRSLGQLFSILSFETGTLNLGIPTSAGLSGQQDPREPPASASPALRLQLHSPCPAFYIGSGDQTQIAPLVWQAFTDQAISPVPRTILKYFFSIIRMTPLCSSYCMYKSSHHTLSHKPIQLL